MKTIAKGPFLGINNRRPDFSLHVDKTGDFLRSAENVDIDNAGNLRRRKAAIRIQAMTGAHSLFTSGDGTRYMVRDSVMYTVTLPSYAETLFKILSSNAPASYVEFNGSIYYSNGTDSGCIKSGVWYPWALPTPAAPTVSTVGGTLYAGKYLVSVSHARLASGALEEEGGVSPATQYELAADGGLRITLPAATAGATHVLVYVSTANGSAPMLAKTVAAGTATADVTLQAELMVGREAARRFEAPLPAGDQLFIHKGALCSVSGSRVYEGIPFKPGYCINAGKGIPFPAAVSNAVPTDGGVYIVADKTYWFPGPVMTKVEGVIPVVLPYGGVKGTSFSSPNKSLHGWFGAKGIVLAGPSGEVEAVMSDDIDLTPPASGVSSVFEADGLRRVVSCGWCVNLYNLAATQYTDYTFTSISGQYGTKADGIYDLAAKGNVPYLIDIGRENFGSEMEKSLPAAYVGVDSEDPMQLRVRTPGGEEYFYDARSCGGGMEIHRIDPGLGLSENWYGLALIGEADFTLASVSFAPSASTRRI